MNLKKILFVFILTLLSSTAVVGCSDAQEEFKNNAQDQLNDNAHGHSH